LLSELDTPFEGYTAQYKYFLFIINVDDLVSKSTIRLPAARMNEHSPTSNWEKILNPVMMFKLAMN
jgi:hypothetical protein